MRVILFLLWIAISPICIAQNSAIPENIRASNSIDSFSGGIMNEMIYGLPLPDPKVIGDAYIDENWTRGKFLMYGQQKFIDGFSIRYDLAKQELEINTQKGVKVLSENQVRSFVTMDAHEHSPALFLNAREFRSEGTAYEGFVEVLQDGPMALVKGYIVKVKRPDYSEAMNVGSQNYKILKKHQLFFVDSGTLHRVPSKKKEIIRLFPPAFQQKVAEYASAQNLSLDKEEHLSQVFRWYNDLESGK